MRLSSLLLLSFATVAFGCTRESLAPELGQLVGRWSAPTQQLQSRGTMDRSFIVGSDSKSENQVITRGLYAAQGAGDLSAREVLYGRIEVSGNMFVVYPDSLVTTDLFYGPTYRHVQRDFSGWPHDSTRFEVRGSELDLEFYTYPADAPVLTREILHRVP